MAHWTIQIVSRPQSWRVAWHKDGQPLGSEFDVAACATERPGPLGSQFRDLFARQERPLAEPSVLLDIGHGMFETWFKPVWPLLEPHVSAGSNHLLIVSDDRRILNLPWELVCLHPGLPLGCDAAWSPRRSSLAPPRPDGELSGGPLRILFLAAAPIDQPQLDYEREEDGMLLAASNLREQVIIHFAETGSFDELGELVAATHPHIVHLSGHGVLTADGSGTFAFEDERGRTDSRDACDIVADVFRGSSVRCVFLNACESSQADAAGLCQALTSAGVPLAVGWSSRVADDMATEFAESFYRRLLHGEPVPVAAAHARSAIRRRGVIRHSNITLQDATFALPQVYCSVAGGEILDSSAPPVPYAGPRTRYTLLGDGIKGLREGFVGRRRQVQRLLPALRDGQITVAVITGIGGAGKSTLATRAANRLEGDGFRVVALRTATGDSPVECARRTLDKLVDALLRAFITEQRTDLHTMLTDGKLPLQQRLRMAVDGLNQLRLAIVLDNFEDALDLETRQIADPELAELYDCLAANLTHGSRLIVTCRYLPQHIASDPGTVLHIALPDLEEHNFWKFVQRDEMVAGRIRRRELTADLLSQLYRRLGGTPGFLETVRQVLRTADLNDVMDDLEGLAPGTLSEERERYFERIFAERLYDALSRESQDLLSRTALSELPLPIHAVAEIAELDSDRAAVAAEQCVAFGLLQMFAEPNLPALYHPPGLLRAWLCAEKRLAKSAGSMVHSRLAAFWRAVYEANCETELRVSIDVALSVCRHHAHLGGAGELFRWATIRWAGRLQRRAEWRIAKALVEEIPEAEWDGECLLALATLEIPLGEWPQARAHLQQALVFFPDQSKEKAAAWHNLASIDVYEGSYAAAREKFGKALDIKQAIGDRAGEAATWHQLATIDLHEGSYADAREKSGKTLVMRQAIGDCAGEVATLHQLATIDLHEGSYADARQKFHKVLEMRQAIGNRAGEAATWHNLATLDVYEGSYAAAREKFGKALDIKQAIGDRAGEAASWHSRATIDLHEGSYADARESAHKALEIMQAIGDHPGAAAAWHLLASIDLQEGSYGAARQTFRNALEALQAMGNRAGEAATWHNLATIDLHEGSYAAARVKAGKALDIEQAIGDRAGEASAWHQLATIDLNEGSYAAARETFGKALEMRQAIGDRAGEAAAWHQLATIDVHEGSYAAAREKFGKALEIAQVIGDRAGEAGTFYQLGFLAHQMGRTDAGTRLVAVSWMIDHTIGHGDAESALQSFKSLCAELGYDQQQFDRVLEEVAVGYQTDRGHSLIDQAFPES